MYIIKEHKDFVLLENTYLYIYVLTLKMSQNLLYLGEKTILQRIIASQLLISNGCYITQWYYKCNITNNTMAYY